MRTVAQRHPMAGVRLLPRAKAARPATKPLRAPLCRCRARPSVWDDRPSGRQAEDRNLRCRLASFGSVRSVVRGFRSSNHVWNFYPNKLRRRVAVASRARQQELVGMGSTPKVAKAQAEAEFSICDFVEIDARGWIRIEGLELPDAPIDRRNDS